VSLSTRSVVILINIGNMFLGALLSLMATYVLIVIFVLKSEIASGGWSSINPITILIAAPIYTLVNIYWLVIPIGLLLGFVIPLFVSKKTKGQALVYGVVTGIIIGLVLAGFSAYDYAMGTSLISDNNVKWWGRFWTDFAWSVPLMIVYCSIWTSAYSLGKAGAKSSQSPSSDESWE